MYQIRTNVVSIINVSFKREQGYYQYTFYIESDGNPNAKSNSVIAVAKMMNAVSIYQYVDDVLYIIDPLDFANVMVDEQTMSIVYDSFTGGKANNIFL